MRQQIKLSFLFSFLLLFSFCFCQRDKFNAICHFFHTICLEGRSGNGCSAISSNTLQISAQVNGTQVLMKVGKGKNFYWRNLFKEFDYLDISSGYETKFVHVVEDFVQGEITFDHVFGEHRKRPFRLKEVKMKIKAFRNLIEEIRIISAKPLREEGRMIWEEAWYKPLETFDLVALYKKMLSSLQEGNAENFCSTTSPNMVSLQAGKKDRIKWNDLDSVSDYLKIHSWRNHTILKAEQIGEKEIVVSFVNQISDRTNGVVSTYYNVHFAEFDSDMRLFNLERTCELVERTPLQAFTPYKYKRRGPITSIFTSTTPSSQ